MEQRNEPELEPCARCGCSILKGAYVCDACCHELDIEEMYERQALHERHEEAARNGEL